MALSDDQWAWAASVLGMPADLAEQAQLRADLDARYDRLGTVTGVVTEVLRERRARLVASPLSVTVPGAVSVNQEGNVRAIDKLLDGMTTDVDPSDLTDTGGLVVVPIVDRWAR